MAAAQKSKKKINTSSKKSSKGKQLKLVPSTKKSKTAASNSQAAKCDKILEESRVNEEEEEGLKDDELEELFDLCSDNGCKLESLDFNCEKYDIVWIKFSKYPLWPACVMTCQKINKTFKLTFKFIEMLDFEPVLSKTFSGKFVAGQNLYSFPSATNQDKFIQNARRSSYCDYIDGAVSAAESYLFNRALDANFNPTKYFVPNSKSIEVNLASIEDNLLSDFNAESPFSNNQNLQKSQS